MDKQQFRSRHDVLSQQTKIKILILDLFRIMENVSHLCSENERHIRTTYFTTRMKMAGFTDNEVTDVYNKARDMFNYNSERAKAWPLSRERKILGT